MKVAILGYGVVGSGVFEILKENFIQLAKRASQEIEVKYILDIRDFTGSEIEKIVVNDFSVIEKDPEVEIVIEVIGGATIAYDFTKRALLAGKHVVTSNKELVATKGTELLKIAKEKNINYMFEASVGGGIPIIRPLIQCLTANNINAITGIVNGTTNYILTKMIEDGESFDNALKDAQAKGYAEKDPSADVLGIDAQRKICILTNLAYQKEVNPDDVYAQGIDKITLIDVKYAQRNNKVIKLLARTVIQDGKTYTFVAPHLVDKTNMLSGVLDVFNAITVTGDYVDDVMFYGKGAGKLATASAVVSDIVDICKHLVKRKDISWQTSDKYISDISDFKCKFYVLLEDETKIPFNNACKLSDDTQNHIAFITEKISLKELENRLSGYKYSYIRVL